MDKSRIWPKDRRRQILQLMRPKEGRPGKTRGRTGELSIQRKTKELDQCRFVLAHRSLYGLLLTNTNIFTAGLQKWSLLHIILFSLSVSSLKLLWSNSKKENMLLLFLPWAQSCCQRWACGPPTEQTCMDRLLRAPSLPTQMSAEKEHHLPSSLSASFLKDTMHRKSMRVSHLHSQPHKPENWQYYEGESKFVSWIWEIFHTKYAKITWLIFCNTMELRKSLFSKKATTKILALPSRDNPVLSAFSRYCTFT